MAVDEFTSLISAHQNVRVRNLFSDMGEGMRVIWPVQLTIIRLLVELVSR